MNINEIENDLRFELIRLRKRARFSTSIMSMKMFCNIKRIYAIESGTTNPTAEEVIRWANICNSSASKLFKKIGY